LEKLEKNKVTLEILVEAEKVEEALERAYRKLVKRVNIPGFRKGKAPRVILERYIGKGALYDEALDDILAESYQASVEETGIRPIGQPDIELLELEEDKPLKFKATVEVMPEVELGDYMKVKESIDREEVTVSEEEVDEGLERLREGRATLVPDEGGEVNQDSFVMVDFEGECDGEPFPPEPIKGYLLQVSEGGFLPGFSEQLIGASVGDEVEVKVTVPEDYPEEEKRGKEVHLKVQIKELKRKELPDLNDEFAKEATEGRFETLQELRENLTNNLRATKQRKADDEYERKVLEEVVKAAQVDVPEVLVGRQLDAMLDDLRATLERQNLSLDAYIEFHEEFESVEQLRESLRPRADEAVKRELVLDTITRKEGVEALPEDLELEAQKIALAYAQPVDTMKSFLLTGDNKRRLEDGIVRRKTVELLCYTAEEVVKRREEEAEEVRKRLEELEKARSSREGARE